MRAESLARIRRALVVACLVVAAAAAGTLGIMDRQVRNIQRGSPPGESTVPTEAESGVRITEGARTANLLAAATSAANEAGVKLVAMTGGSSEERLRLEADGTPAGIARWFHSLDQQPGAVISAAELYPARSGITAGVSLGSCPSLDGCGTQGVDERPVTREGETTEATGWASQSRWEISGADYEEPAGSGSGSAKPEAARSETVLRPRAPTREDSGSTEQVWRTPPSLAGSVLVSGELAYIYWIGGTTAARSPGETLGNWRINEDGSLDASYP